LLAPGESLDQMKKAMVARDITDIASPPEADEDEDVSDDEGPVVSTPAVVAGTKVVITDGAGTYTLEGDSAAQALQHYLSLSRRLGRVRRSSSDYAINGVAVTDAIHLHLPREMTDKPRAWVVFRTDGGVIEAPFEDVERAKAIARSSAMILLRGSGHAFDAMDGQRCILRANNVSVRT
jgi:hypothetical protein